MKRLLSLGMVLIVCCVFSVKNSLGEEPYVIGLNLGLNKIEAGLVDLRGKLVAERKMQLSSNLSPETLVANVSDLVNDLCRSERIELSRDILGIGFGTAGNFAEDGTVAWHKNSSIVGISVKKLLKEHFGLPVFVGSIGRTMALAEAWFGAGRPYQNYLFFLVHEVVDGAIVFNRSVVVGKRHFSSLIGHKPVSDSGRLCYCGQRGCLDVVASDDALCAEAESYAMTDAKILRHMLQGQSVTKSSIIEAAAHGDRFCQELLKKQGAYLGEVIAEMINLIDVEAVIVAINLEAPESDMELNTLTSTYTKSLNIPHRAPDIVFSKMKRDLFIIGPATLVIRRVFSPELRISLDHNNKPKASLNTDQLMLS